MKTKFTMKDVNSLVIQSLFTPVFGKTLSIHSAADIIYRDSIKFKLECSKTVINLALGK